ncbi:MAG: DNA polymerase IV [Lachnospiraceae bacterium]|nr:DNA polymerase IV [Lachnospiraceae bacterium]
MFECERCEDKSTILERHKDGDRLERVIFHIDVNSAFLSWEAVYRLYHLGGKLDLRTIPSAVGGNQEKRHGIILAKSIPAKQFHVRTGESIVEAKQKCPELVIVPPNYELYNRSSKAFIDLCREFSNKVEQYSIDEAYVDMTGCMGDPVELAKELNRRCKKELGVAVNVGVSNCKLLAKMGSSSGKKDSVHTLWPEEIEEKLWPLPVEELFFIGNATKRKLNGFGVRTIGELAKLDDRFLYANMKSHGLLIKQYANGLDNSEVITESPANKGYGNSLTTPRDVCDSVVAKQYLLSLAETVSARLRAEGAKIRVVSVSIRDYDLKFCGHQRTLMTPTDLTVEIYAEACRCFDELWNGTPIRHLGIHTSQVTMEETRQISFFDRVDYEKQKKVETAVDILRKRFGQDIVKRACFVSTKEKTCEIDHMSGGISRDKRTVDYSKEEIR